MAFQSIQLGLGLGGSLFLRALCWLFGVIVGLVFGPGISNGIGCKSYRKPFYHHVPWLQKIYSFSSLDKPFLMRQVQDWMKRKAVGKVRVQEMAFPT
jgi:hypothetical protein